MAMNFKWDAIEVAVGVQLGRGLREPACIIRLKVLVL